MTMGVGIIGCGNISKTYFELVPMFQGIEIRACADLVAAPAEAKAEQYNVRAESVDALMQADDIDIIVNLTIPDAHADVTHAALTAGCHVYSEKPLALTLEDGRALRDLAAAHNLTLCSAPDTFLGGAHQQARAEIDSGRVGRIVAGTAHVMGRGMEHWHPNPDFFFLPGAGPMLDIGPYYVTNLINLIGPVVRVAALTSRARDTRVIESAARKGEEIPVKTPTNIHALLEFANGATVTVSTSWDVFAHRHANMELYGTEGAIFVPDPNFFGGLVEVAGKDGDIRPLEAFEHPFGVANQQEDGQEPRANYRAAGLADMAAAICAGRAPRCGIDVALHAVEVMTAVLRSGEEGAFVDIQSTCERPAALGPEAAQALLG